MVFSNTREEIAHRGDFFVFDSRHCHYTYSMNLTRTNFREHQRCGDRSLHYDINQFRISLWFGKNSDAWGAGTRSLHLEAVIESDRYFRLIARVIESIERILAAFTAREIELKV